MQNYNKLHISERDAIRMALSKIDNIASTDEETFWVSFGRAFEEINNIFKSSYGAIILQDKRVGSEPILKVGYNLSKELFTKTYIGELENIIQLNNDGVPKIHSINIEENTIGFHLIESITSTEKENIPYTYAVWPINIENDIKGEIYMFFNPHRDVENSLPISEELVILEPFITQIRAAFENHKAITQFKILANLSKEWLQDVVHEVIQPISGIVAEEAFSKKLLNQIIELSNNNGILDYEKINKIGNHLTNIHWMSLNAEQITRNFAWMAGRKDLISNLSYEIDLDFTKTLIDTAREKQTQASLTNKFGPDVEKESLLYCNGKVKIEKRLFRHALLNILDNAVKYSESRTNISILAGKSNNNRMAAIRIRNYGKIPIIAGEEKLIFEKLQRGRKAKESSISGSGIGLTVAQEIMKLHGGQIFIKPSELVTYEDQELYETNVLINLPLIEEVKND